MESSLEIDQKRHSPGFASRQNSDSCPAGVSLRGDGETNWQPQQDCARIDSRNRQHCRDISFRCSVACSSFFWMLAADVEGRSCWTFRQIESQIPRFPCSPSWRQRGEHDVISVCLRPWEVNCSCMAKVTRVFH